MKQFIWFQSNQKLCVQASVFMYYYYINTNEIPSELQRENLISSRVKITCYPPASHMKISPLLWLHNKPRLSDRKMLWYFIGVYIINRTLHGHLEIPNFSSCVKKKYFTCLLRSLVTYFSTLEGKFRISAWPCNILYLCCGSILSVSFIF